MTRICIIGNSHVAALKLGWDKISGDYPDISVTFFGVPGKWLRAIDVQDGTLTPTTGKHKRFFEKLSGGQDTVHIKDFDLFVVVGLELSIFRWLQMYKQARHAPFNLGFGTPQIFDAETFDLCRQNVFDGTSGEVIFSGLREAGAEKVYVCPQPMPSALIREADEFWTQLFEVENVEAVENAYREDMARGFPEAAGILWQPEGTRAGPLLTDPGQSHGSKRINLTADHGDNDYQHMNDTFGAEVLRRIAEVAA